MLRYVTLGLLRDGQARHGYALMKAYRELSGLDIGPGSFYRDLPRLVTDGLVKPVENPPDADERRLPYAITAAGAAAFDAWFSSEPPEGAVEDAEDGFPARILFFDSMAPETTQRVIALWEEYLVLRRKRLERGCQAASGRMPESFPVRSLLLERRLKRAVAEIAFLKEIESLYERWTAPRDASRNLSTDARKPASPLTAGRLRSPLREAKRGVPSSSRR